jgi:hypothetical protein
MLKVICPYCCERAKLTRGGDVYRRNYAPVWLCEPCEAWVGTHKDDPDHAPLGTLAKAELRALRQRAHQLFDPLWKAKMQRDGCSKSKARAAGYDWLAGQLGREPGFAAVHIGYLDEEGCRAVIEACERVYGGKLR